MPIYGDKQIQPEKKSFEGTFDIFHLLNKISISIRSLLRGFNNKQAHKHMHIWNNSSYMVKRPMEYQDRCQYMVTNKFNLKRKVLKAHRINNYQIWATEKSIFINSRKCMGGMRSGVCKHQKQSIVCRFNFKPLEQKNSPSVQTIWYLQSLLYGVETGQ